MNVDVGNASESPSIYQGREGGRRESSKRRDKLLDIERGKGIGIALVVYGHLVMAGTLGEQYWYHITKSSIYLFHMPFFMYLSGFVFFYTKSHLALGRHYASFVGKRFDRLLVPFFALAFIIVLGKSLASQAIHIDDDVSSVSSGIASIFTNAPDNPSIFIWYLLVLFVYSIVTPVLWPVAGRNVLPLLAVAFVLHFIPAPEDFYVARILRFYVFFVFGMFAAQHAAVVFSIYRKYLVWFFVLFAGLLYVGRDLPYALLWCGLASIPVIHGVLRLPMFDSDRALAWLGQNSMVIYLLNTIFIGLAKGVYVKVLPYHGLWFSVMIAVLLVCGLFLPIFCKAIVPKLPFGGYVYKYVR